MKYSNLPFDLSAEPRVVGYDAVPRHTRQTVDRSNALVRGKFETAQSEKTPSSGVLFALHLARTRWEILESTVKDAAIATGVSEGTIGRLELPKKPEEKLYSDPVRKILSWWDREGVPFEVREQLLELIGQRKPGVFGFYEMLRFAVENPDDLADISSTGKASRRKLEGVVPDYREVLGIVDRLHPKKEKKHRDVRERRLRQGRDAWTESSVAQMTSRTIEEPLARFHAGLEIYLAEQYGLPLTPPSLHSGVGKKNKLSHIDVLDVMGCEWLPWNRIEHLARAFFTSKELPVVQKAWEQGFEADRSRPTFGRMLKPLRDDPEREMSNHEYAYCLNIRPPQERRGEKHVYDRDSYCYNPSSEVRRVLDRGMVSSFAPPRCLAELTLKEGEDDVRTSLKAQYFEDRRRHYRRRGILQSSEKGLELRITGEWNGILPKQAAEYLLSEYEYDDQILNSWRLWILDIEEGRRPAKNTTQAEYDSVVQAYETLGSLRVNAALDRKRSYGEVSAYGREFSTVEEMLRKLRESLKSYEAFHAMITEYGEANDFVISIDRLRAIATGKVCPPLSDLQHIADACNVDFNPEVRKDWFVRFPTMHHDRASHSTKDPLARLLMTLMYSEFPTLITFAEERLPGVQAHAISKLIRDLDSGAEVNWIEVQRILNACEGTQSRTAKFARLLFESNRDLAGTVEILAAQPTFTKHTDPETFVGLTANERKQFFPCSTESSSETPPPR